MLQFSPEVWVRDAVLQQPEVHARIRKRSVYQMSVPVDRVSTDHTTTSAVRERYTTSCRLWIDRQTVRHRDVHYVYSMMHKCIMVKI